MTATTTTTETLSEQPETQQCAHCEQQTAARLGLSRREALRRGAGATALASALASWPFWMPRLAFAKHRAAPVGDTLICIFLRGGADGLNVVVPHGDAAYYSARPTLAVARPEDGRAERSTRALDLDGFFGLHPALAPLLPIVRNGHLTAVHATGSPDATRSHFDAMDFMERGTAQSNLVDTGWIGRHLSALDTGNTSPLRGLGWGDALQLSLRGAVNTMALQSITNYHLQGRDDRSAAMLSTLNALYAADSSALQTLADDTNKTLNLMSSINAATYQPANGATYNAQDDFGLALMQTATLIKANVGLEVAAIDVGGWDTHEKQALNLQSALSTLAAGLRAFYDDIGDAMRSITLVVMSEFGRRVQENGSRGTDHGHGNLMLVMGGHVAPTPVIAQWPGLAEPQLADGDLAITIDYRDVLSEILARRLNNPHLDQVFPGFTPTPRGIVTA